MTLKNVIKKQKLFINGNWIEATEYTSLYSPYNGELIAEIPKATIQETDEAIEAAFLAKDVMKNLTAYERSTILSNLVRLLEENSEIAAEIIASEAAKPIKTAQMEVARTIQTYKFAAQEANKIYGETIPLDAAPSGKGKLGFTKREPIGVIGAITPFNFPMNLVAHKVGPAIASGNTIVLKPASQTPLSAFFIAELLQKAGLPDGALNIVTGSGRVVGDRIVNDDRVKMITFTGSPEVGKEIRNKSGLKRTTLELGSNAAVIIDEGIEIDKIINRCVRGAFDFQGQVCISLQRIYVHEKLYEPFVSKFVEETKNLVIGDPLDTNTEVSALISEGDVDRVLAWINEAKSNDSIIETGGTRIGNIVLPTVLTNVSPESKVSCQEVFGPVVIINPISSVDEGILLVNNSRFGLQAGIYTNNIYKAISAVDTLEVGGVIINDIPTFRVDHMPYGGVKESGTGKEGIKYAIEEMTEMKLVVINKD